MVSPKHEETLEQGLEWTSVLPLSQSQPSSKLEHDGDTGIISAPEPGLPSSVQLGLARLNGSAPRELVCL